MKCAARCGKDAAGYCTRCDIYGYCSKECQSDHWPVHRLWCGKPSTCNVNGMLLTKMEAHEFKHHPVQMAPTRFSALRLRIRTRMAHRWFDHELPDFPAFSQPLWVKAPPYQFYTDRKNRPTRVFGVHGDAYDTIGLHSDGTTFFMSTGTPLEELTPVEDWGTKHAKIHQSPEGGIFLDPLGFQIAISLAASTGYNARGMCDQHANHLGYGAVRESY